MNIYAPACMHAALPDRERYRAENVIRDQPISLYQNVGIVIWSGTSIKLLLATSHHNPDGLRLSFFARFWTPVQLSQLLVFQFHGSLPQDAAILYQGQTIGKTNKQNKTRDGIAPSYTDMLDL